MTDNPYKQLAQRLDALPNGFPLTEDGEEIRLLEKIFEPEEAALAAKLRLTRETPAQVAERLGGDAKTMRKMLKGMVKKGLITAGRVKGETGMGYGLMPFVVGIYEMQINRIDAEMAQLFEDYYLKVYSHALVDEPQVHRVIPVGETVRNDMEVRPYESAADIVNGAKAWGVVDCICRKQKALIGDPCDHPVDVCMVLGQVPGMFDNTGAVSNQTQEESLATLQRAADAGLVHSVSNNQKGHWYICNCCTCSCGILRGMSEMGIANVVARSAFVNTVDEDLCVGCEDCVEYCQFDALELQGSVMTVNYTSCVGCGVCVPACNDEAMTLVRRPEEEIKPIPVTERDWMAERAAVRGLDMNDVL
jgi:Na+-translocating ferredoxin:NAD+ oxidoreductase subunit B